MHSIHSFLPDPLERLLRSDSPSRDAMSIAWRHVVGAQLARVSSVIRREGRTLRVAVQDARWRIEIERSKPLILTRLSELLGPFTVTELSCDIRARSSAPTERTARASHRPSAPTIGLDASHITDPELRERFIRAASKYVALARAKEESS